MVPPGCPLSPRQYEVLDLVADGLTYRQIAERLGITLSTVRTILGAAFRKFGVHRAAQAVAILGRNGWHGWKPPPAVPEPPLAVSHPFLHAYLREFDSWLASGMRDDRCRDGMRIALRGAQTTRRAA